MPEGLDVHIVMDNVATHKTKPVHDWFAKRPRWHVHFTPTGASWINQVERFFVVLTKRALRRGIPVGLTIPIQFAAPTCRHVIGIDDILDDKWHAVERPADWKCVGGAGTLHGALRVKVLKCSDHKFRQCNPIEMAFSKLKTLIRKAAARTYDQLWQAVGHVCDLFSEEECYNCFKATGYEAN